MRHIIFPIFQQLNNVKFTYWWYSNMLINIAVVFAMSFRLSEFPRTSCGLFSVRVHSCALQITASLRDRLSVTNRNIADVSVLFANCKRENWKSFLSVDVLFLLHKIFRFYLLISELVLYESALFVKVLFDRWVHTSINLSYSYDIIIIMFWILFADHFYFFLCR